MSHAANFEVGQRVHVYPGSSDERAGTIVEDFGDTAGMAVTVGDSRIVEPSRRWAVLLDDGSLVFADTVDLRAAG
jgi:hypothetical protein